MLEVSELVNYLRLSVRVQDTEGLTEKDSNYLEMSDEDLILFLKVVATRDFPQLTSLENITSDMVYPLTLLAKKELYHTLAVKEAPLVNMTADNNNQLLRGQRFEHYMKLISQIDAEYNDFIDNGGAGGYTLSTYDVLLTQRYATKRNYDKGQPPVLSAYIDKVSYNSAEIFWEYSTNIFFSSKVYFGKGKLYNLYADKDKQISSKATLLKKSYDARQTSLRISGLEPDTEYSVLVEVTNASLISSFFELNFKTLKNVISSNLNITKGDIKTIPTLEIKSEEV